MLNSKRLKTLFTEKVGISSTLAYTDCCKGTISSLYLNLGYSSRVLSRCGIFCKSNQHRGTRTRTGARERRYRGPRRANRCRWLLRWFCTNEIQRLDVFQRFELFRILSNPSKDVPSSCIHRFYPSRELFLKADEVTENPLFVYC